MRLRWRLFGHTAALLSAVALVGCSPTIRELNLRPERHYQGKLSLSGRIMRMQAVGDETLLEIADVRENRLLVRSSRPVDATVGEWVKVTGVLVPEARVGDTTVYDVLTAEEISRTRGPWLPDLM